MLTARKTVTMLLLQLIEQRIAHKHNSVLDFDELLKSVTAQKLLFKKCLNLCQKHLPPYLVQMLKQGLVGLTAYN